MVKFTLFLILACVSYGLLELASTEESALQEKDKTESLEYQGEMLRAGLEEDIGRDSEDINRAALRSTPLASSLLNSKQSPSVETVDCYACTNCENVKSNTPSKTCPHTFVTHKQHRCVVYAEQYKHMQKPWYIRGCVSERGSCDDIKKAHVGHEDIVSLLHCHECEGDRCNRNSAASLSDFTMAFLAMVVTPFVAKHTLS